MFAKIYDSLPDEARRIRTAVFMEEQGFKEEFDGTDDISKHIVMFDGDAPVGVCRFFKGENDGCYIVGRLAVIKPYRGKNVGAAILSEAERAVESMGGKSIVLHAQTQAREFYEKQGYTQFGEQDFEENCPHIWMNKNILRFKFY